MPQDTETGPIPPTTGDGDEPAAQPNYLVALIVAAAFLLDSLDGTILIAALPAIGHDFGVSPLRVNLAVTAYLLSVAAFIPASGWIADRFGARRVFMAAIGLFVLSSIACGLAGGLGWLILFRVMQGAAGAMMTPVGRLLLIRSFPRAQVATAFVYMSVPVMFGPVLGPLLGGLIATYAHWRLIFFVNVPIGLLGMALAWRFIRDMPAEPRRPFDLWGFLLCAVALAGAQMWLEQMVHPIIDARLSLACLVAAVAAAVAYLRHARRRARPALEIDLLRLRVFRIAFFSGGLARIGMNGTPFLLQLQLQLGWGWSAARAGVIVGMVTVGALVLKPLMRHWLQTLGFRRLLSFNAVLGGMLVAGFAAFTPTMPLWLMVGYVVLYGISRSIQFNSTQALLYCDVPRERQSASVALGGVGQQVTMSLGISLAAVAVAQVGDWTGADIRGSISTAFLLVALVCLGAGLGFRQLRPEDARDVSGNRPARPAASTT